MELDLADHPQPFLARIHHAQQQIAVAVVARHILEREFVLAADDWHGLGLVLGVAEPAHSTQDAPRTVAHDGRPDWVEDVGSEGPDEVLSLHILLQLLSHPRLGLDGCPVDAKLGPEPALHCPPHAQLELFVQQLRPAVQLADEDLLVEDWSPHAGDGARERPGATGATAMRKLNLSPVFSMQPDGTHARVVLPPHASHRFLSL
mmetsp:Transcript_29818/g.60603  ORF Transcript_29818/g.60603 Transcript_29818/m.60603 type:complete len:204 (+) Transcript_29818:155-766(+)